MAKFSYITIIVLAALHTVFEVPLVSWQSQFNPQNTQVFDNNGVVSQSFLSKKLESPKHKVQQSQKDHKI
jgi:hypothetical protein